MTESSVATGIGPRVGEARARLGWTKEALAFKTGLSWSAIAQIESGRRRNLRPDTLTVLASALGLTIDYLVRGGPPRPPMLDHKALLYSSDDELVRTAGPFLAEGVEHSEALIAVTTDDNVEHLREHLGRAAEEVEFVESSTWYSSPAQALQAYTSFANAKLAHEGAPWVRILGEPLWQGRSEEEVRQWTLYESLINLVFDAWPITVLCPYDERVVHPEIAQRARLTHPHTVGCDGVTSSAGYSDPGQFVLTR